MKKSVRAFAAVLAAGLFAAIGAGAQDIAPGGVMVFGATGKLGSEIVKLLVAKNETVIAFARPKSDRQRLAGLAIATTEGDAMSAADVEAAVTKAKPRVVINALARPRDQWGFWDTTQINITNAAKKAGVPELIFISSVGVGDSAGAYTPEARERTKVVHAERLIAEENVKASGLAYVIIRIGGISWYGEPATGNAQLTEDRSVMGMVKYADMARLVVDCINNAKCAGKTWASMDPNLKLPERR
jgi:uncharacterized protein YbjT (DUF2867 family)